MKNGTYQPPFSRLLLFGCAAYALILSGSVYASKLNWSTSLIFLLTIFPGVIIVYRLNDCFKVDLKISKALIDFFKHPLHIISTLILIIIAFPLQIMYLGFSQYMMLIAGSIIGALYAVPIKIFDYKFRLKNILIVKNLLIAQVWSLLVLVGIGLSNMEGIFFLHIFVFIQVFLGSIIRDMPDIKNDQILSVNTIPSTFGRLNTLIFLHSINAITLIVFFIIPIPDKLLYLVYFIFISRTINLIGLGHGNNHKLWTQIVNLHICTLIFLFLFIYP